MIERKLGDYEEYMKLNFHEQNLKAVLNNNIVALRQLHKHEQHGESIKLLDSAIHGKFRQTEDQLLSLKINKLLLVLNKNKVNEFQSILSDIEEKYE